MTHRLNRRQALGAILAGPLLRAPSLTPQTSGAGRADASRITIAILLFPEVALLDLVGPLQVFRGLDSSYTTVVVSTRVEPILTDAGIRLDPHLSLADVPKPDVVLVPGGAGSVAAMADDAIQRYLGAVASTATIVSSVCTGALVLAAAGLLEGRRAATHWAYARELELLGARYVRDRWVADGKFMTSAGVSAGIDMSFALVARLAGRAEAQRIQLGIEYDPRPPFGGIDWSQVGDADLKRQRQGGTGRRLQDADRLLARRPDLLRKLRKGGD